MIFKKTAIPDVWLIEPERIEDERGFFARTFCVDEFRKHGIEMQVVQCNVSYNPRKGTLRGLHHQTTPYEETKVVFCTRGALFDVAVDLRHGSPTWRRWVGVELTAANGLMLCIPKGCAHGFQTLEDNTEVRYVMGESYHPEASRGVRWDDPSLQIAWPVTIQHVSAGDRNLQFLANGSL
jgi:dTDP-4-dehydrorhamnose 3,5-epimerase